MEIKEIWKSIENYPEYQISSFGRVKSLKYGKERMIKQGINKNGYCKVVLCEDKKQKSHLVHRLVCTAFLPNPNNYPQINHKNEQKTDNRIDNLEWCTQKYNLNYGTRNKKISIANSISHKGKVLSQEHKDNIGKIISIVRQKPILQLSKSGNIILRKWDSAKQVSELLKINCGGIGECCRGKRKSAKGYKWMYYEDYVNKMNILVY